MSGEAIVKEAKKYLSYNNRIDFETWRKIDNTVLVVLVYKKAAGKDLIDNICFLINMG